MTVRRHTRRRQGVLMGLSLDGSIFYVFDCVKMHAVLECWSVGMFCYSRHATHVAL